MCIGRVGHTRPSGDPLLHEFFETTEVLFGEVSEADICAYVAQEVSWKGKAGAYGIQDAASVFIQGIRGDYYNVMGFPLFRFVREMRNFESAA